MRILVNEDNRDILANVMDYLQLKGYTVDCAQDGVSGLHLAVSEHYDLIVLDIMLPGMDGYQLCQRLRDDAGRDTPIIMLTAKGDETSRIQGLEIGADDYLPKPFNPRELVARMKAVLRRQAPQVPGAPSTDDDQVTFGEFTLNLATRELTRGDEVNMLTTGEFAVLKALKESGAELPVDTLFLFSISEEVGVGASSILTHDVASMVAATTVETHRAHARARTARERERRGRSRTSKRGKRSRAHEHGF